MHQVKLFFHNRAPQLAEELRSWLEQVNGQVKLLSMTLDSNQYGHCLSILYEQAPGPYYWSQVHMHRRHDNLEEMANQELRAAAHGPVQLMTHGSNDYGHCICLVGVRG